MTPQGASEAPGAVKQLRLLLENPLFLAPKISMIETIAALSPILLSGLFVRPELQTFPFQF